MPGDIVIVKALMQCPRCGDQQTVIFGQSGSPVKTRSVWCRTCEMSTEHMQKGKVVPMG